MKKILLLILFVVLSCSGFAATYYSRVATGNFATAGTWSVNRSGTPTNAMALAAGDIFFIQNGHSITLAANQSANQITIESGGSLAPNNNRTLTLTNPLIIDNGGTLSLTTRTLTFGASRIENSGSITGSTGEITRTTGTFTNTATGTVTISGAAAFVMGTGNFINNNTSSSVNFGSSPITISGTANQSIGGFTTTGRFTASKTAGITTLTGGINAGGITKSGAGILDMDSGTHTSTNTVILTAGTMNGGSSTINANVTSATAWQGTGSVFVPETSTINFGGGAQILSATGTKTFYNLTLSNSGLKTIASTTVNNILSMEGNATASVAPTYGASATLRYNTATGRTAGPEWLTTFTATGGVITDNTGAITTNDNKVFDLDAPLTINSGATLTPATGHTFSFGGDLVNNGTWTPSDGAVTIGLTRAVQSIGSFSTTGLVSMTKASGDATFSGNVNGGALTINGGGRLFLGFGLTHAFAGDWTSTAGILRGNTSTMQIGGNGIVTAGTFVSNNSNVEFNGSGAQSIPAFNYHDLTTSTGNAKTLTGTTTVSSVLTINGSTTLDLGAESLTLSGAGNALINSGTFTSGTSTVNFSNGASVDIPALNYYNLDITGGPRVLADTGTIGIAGVFTPGLGGFTVTGSTVALNGTDQTIPEFTFNNLILNGSGTKKILTSTTATVNSIVIENGPTLDIEGTGVINITGP